MVFSTNGELPAKRLTQSHLLRMCICNTDAHSSREERCMCKWKPACTLVHLYIQQSGHWEKLAQLLGSCLLFSFHVYSTARCKFARISSLSTPDTGSLTFMLQIPPLPTAMQWHIKIKQYSSMHFPWSKWFHQHFHDLSGVPQLHPCYVRHFYNTDTFSSLFLIFQ